MAASRRTVLCVLRQRRGAISGTVGTEGVLSEAFHGCYEGGDGSRLAWRAVGSGGGLLECGGKRVGQLMKTTHPCNAARTVKLRSEIVCEEAATR